MKHYLGISSIILTTACLIWSVSQASALPTGPNISFGANPIFSLGGNSATTITAPPNQTMIISDIVLGATGTGSSSYHTCVSVVDLTNGVGENLGSFRLSADTTGGSSQANLGSWGSHRFGSGIPLAATDTLSVNISGNCSVNYTLSGYYTHP